MKHSEYQFIHYKPEYLDQIIQLQKYLWGEDLNLNNAYMDWKYNKNPYIKHPYIYLVVYCDEVIGMVGMFGSRWQAGIPRQEFNVLCAADLVIHPDHRGNGLFKPLMKTALNDLTTSPYDYIFITSGNTYSSMLSLKLGWKVIGSLENLELESEPSFSRLLRRYASKLSLIPEQRLHPFFNIDNAYKQKDAGQTKISCENFPRVSEMAELVKRTTNDALLRQVRDESFFRYRYKNPHSEYRFLYWADKKMEGYLVLQTSAFNHSERSWANIVDWEASNEMVREELLSALTESGGFDDLSIWSATLPDSAKSLLSRTGFTLSQDPTEHPHPTVLIRPIHDSRLNSEWIVSGINLLNIQDWDLKGIYSDGY